MLSINEHYIFSLRQQCKLKIGVIVLRGIFRTMWNTQDWVVLFNWLTAFSKKKKASTSTQGPKYAFSFSLRCYSRESLEELWFKQLQESNSNYLSVISMRWMELIIHLRNLARFGTICTILKNVKITDGEVLILVKLKPATLIKVTLLYGCLSHF